MLFNRCLRNHSQVISLYPNLLPSVSSFTRAMPPLHDIADITQLCKNQTDMLTQYKLFLMNFLEEEKNASSAHKCILVRTLAILPSIHKRVVAKILCLLQEIEVALLKLYAEMDSPDLNDLIESSIADVALPDCFSSLEQFGRHHALALLHNKAGEPDKALHIWSRILAGDIDDRAFPGTDFVIKYLSR